jgi:phosphotransferase system HPr (HPr) family protein
MTERPATIRNAYGIHVRPSSVIVKAAKEYAGGIEVTSSKGVTVDIKNILGLISLGLTCGQAVTIRVNGPDEEAVAVKMAELFETHFDFPR